MATESKIVQLTRNYATTISDRARKIRDVCWTFYGDTPETDITDLLADIRHFCSAHGLGFVDLDCRACNHYIVEVVAETLHRGSREGKEGRGLK